MTADALAFRAAARLMSAVSPFPARLNRKANTYRMALVPSLKHPVVGAAVLACLAASTLGADPYSVLHSFDAGQGRSPTAIVLGGKALYGVTAYGGSYDQGVVYRVGTDGNGYGVLKEFSGPDGANPWSGLAKSGNTLFGVTGLGGAYNWGVLYRLSTAGSDYTVLKHFNPEDGSLPCALVISGTTIYGTTEIGGLYGRGVLYRINTDGTGYNVLRHFSGVEANPEKGLLLSGSTLYGINSCHNVAPGGILYKIEIDGSGFQVLHSFSETDSGGFYPMGQIVLADGRLYGASCWGGGSSYGTIYAVATNGADFAVLLQIGAGGGFEPIFGVELCGENLVSAQAAGGSQGFGSLIMVNTNGSGYTLVKHFMGPEGGHPEGNLVIADNIAYGTTAVGGPKTNGVLFSMALPLPPVITLQPVTQTAEEGSTLQLGVCASGRLPLRYQWYHNQTNCLTGHTNATLQLSNITSFSAGSYCAIVTNDAGLTTSRPATVSVIPAIPRRSVPALAIAGSPGDSLELQYADTVGLSAGWAPLNRVTISATPQYYFDLTPALPNARFYRARQNDAAGPASLLNLSMVPALTITGTPDSTVRLDYIDQFGPTNAWSPLATILLTNPPQLYFDLQSIGQPPRLWRTVSPP